jgi:hypothetical protein
VGSKFATGPEALKAAKAGLSKSNKSGRKENARICGLRLHECYKLALGRSEEDNSTTALFLAYHVIDLKGDPLERLKKWSVETDARVPVNTLTKQLDKAYNKPLKFGPEAAAKFLGVTIAERDALGLTTIGAIDMSRDDRLERYKKRRRESDRVRKVILRMETHPNAMFRAEYEAKSLSRTKPWAAEGISRRTWYRRRGTCPPESSGGTTVSASLSSSLYKGADQPVSQAPLDQHPKEEARRSEAEMKGAANPKPSPRQAKRAHVHAMPTPRLPSKAPSEPKARPTISVTWHSFPGMRTSETLHQPCKE